MADKGGRTQQYGYSSLQVTFWCAITFPNNSTDQEPSSVLTLCGERAMVPGKGSLVEKGELLCNKLFKTKREKVTSTVKLKNIQTKTDS